MKSELNNIHYHCFYKLDLKIKPKLQTLGIEQNRSK